MQFTIYGYNNVELCVIVKEEAFTNATDKNDLISKCSDTLFHLQTQILDCTYQCLVDIEELSVFLQLLKKMLSQEAKSASFSSHDNLFCLSFERLDGSIKCNFWYKYYQPIRVEVSVDFMTDETQLVECLRTLSALKNKINHNISFDESVFIKWW